jgi:peptidoglycan hydrolase-like protein with peptidoglycan-binding domain
VVVAVTLAGATAWWLRPPRGAPDAAASVPIDTAAVVRTTLTRTTQVPGTLGYAGSYTLVSQLQGTITALPTPGSVLRRGQRVYEVDGAPVFLFYGARPAWRPFEPGMPPGPDVRQLEQNLAALGFAPDVLVDNRFSPATEGAVRAWQRATGQPRTGRVDLGRVLFAPTALRIEADEVALGAPAPPGQPVATASSPTPLVTLAVPPTQTYLVRAGDRVGVTLPSGAASTGHVTDISTVAQAPPDQQARGQGAAPDASIPAHVTLDRPSVARGLDQAPVTVTVTDERVTNVLAVPVTALVALAGGGFGVWLDKPQTPRRLVAVTPGLFTDTLVQVTAAGLRVGDRVEVPAQ